MKGYAHTHDIPFGEMIERLRSTEQSSAAHIPLAILSGRDLGIMESLVLHMRDYHSLGYSEIGRLINRDPRTIWTTYASASKKRTSPPTIPADSPRIPVQIFSDRRFGPLEALTVHLKGTGRNYSHIAALLNRDPRTIWTAYQRAVRKAQSTPSEVPK